MLLTFTQVLIRVYTAMRLSLIFAIVIAASVNGNAQQNLQQYTPSILFNKGQWEFKSFQNLYTQTKSFNANLAKQESGRGHESYFSSINQFLIGLSPSINIGADVWIKSVALEKVNANNQNWTAVSVAGPKIKIAPFKTIPRLSIQSSLLFPVAKNQEGVNNKNAFLENDRTLWLTQLFYDKQFNDKWQLFLQQAFWYSIVRDSFRENNYVQTPTSGFLSYFPTTRVTIYAMTEFWPTHYNSNKQEGEAFATFFAQSGIGGKYQIVLGRLEIEGLYTNFWLGSEGEGAGQTFNVGIRVIR
jgi:hypothetical protein